MSIPVYEMCNHKTQDIAPSKARHFLNTQPDHWSEQVPGDLSQGIRFHRCLLHVAVPYQLLADTLDATHAPTRRKIHPWLERDTAEAAIKAKLLASTSDDHKLVFTERGHTTLQHAYAKLLQHDIDRGLEVVGAFVNILRDAARDAATARADGALHEHDAHDDGQTPTADSHPPSWQCMLKDVWTRIDERAMPIPYDVFQQRLRDVPERLIKLLIHVEPGTAERLLREAL